MNEREQKGNKIMRAKKWMG